MRAVLTLVFMAGGHVLAAEQWTPALAMRVQNVRDVLPSPDGRRVLWTQTRAIISSERSEYLTHVFLASSDGSGGFQLTRGDKSATDPRFSPDGRFVYFMSDRSGKRDLFRIAVDG